MEPQQEANGQEGKKPPHKPSGDDCSRSSSQDVYQITPSSEKRTPDVGQQNSINLFNQDGGHQKQSSYGNFQEPLGLLAVKGDHSYSRIPPLQTEHRSRLSIQECDRLERMETMHPNVQEHLCQPGRTEHRPVRVTYITPNEGIYESETRPIMPSSGRITTELDAHVPIRFPSIQFNREGFEKSTRSASDYDNNNPSLGDTALVSHTSGYVNTSTIIAHNASGYSKRSSGECPSPCIKWVPSTRGLAGVRTRMEGQEISARAAELITKSRSLGTRNSYDSAWKKFCGWCSGKEIDPIQCHITFILDFLGELFDKGLQYRTINVYRSSISAYHHHWQNKPVGENTQICALMKGIGNERPPKPRYCKIWDVETILKFIKSWEENTTLSNKQLTLKLTFLLAVTSAHRGSELKCLKIQGMN